MKAAAYSSKRSAGFLIFCLVLLAVGFRIVNLKADPPADFDWSGGYFADEGYWSHNARNLVLFGNAVQDEWDGRIMSPVFAATQSLVFQLFGVGLAQVRFLGILCAVLLVTTTFLLLRKRHGDDVAFLCAALVGLNYPLLVLARQGILDPFATALAWMALLCAAHPASAAPMLSGILLVVACTTKFFMIYALAPVAASLLLHSPDRRKRILLFVAGASAAAGAWFFLNYLPHREALLEYNRFYASQQEQSWRVVDLLKNIALQPFFLYAVKSPALLLLANLMVWFLVARPRSAGAIERACWLWLVTGVLFFALWRYRPLRYYTSLFPPLAVLAGLGLLRLEDAVFAMRSRKARILMIAGIALPVLQIAFVLADRFTGQGIVPAELGIHTADAIVFILISALAMWVLLRAPFRTGKLRLAFFAAFLLCDLRNYTQWMAQPQYAALEISADLQRRLGHAVLAGQWAPELVLENRLRAVPVWKGFVNSDDPFTRYGVTHLLLWRYPLGDEAAKFSEWYPEQMKQFRPVARYTIKNSELDLYQRENLP